MNDLVSTPQNGIQYGVRFAFCNSILLHLSVFSRKSVWLISLISVCCSFSACVQCWGFFVSNVETFDSNNRILVK
jgi:hypothetical protein